VGEIKFRFFIGTSNCSQRCHCGLPLHYSDPDVRDAVERCIQEKGEFVTVTVCGRSWRVPRHYIALHGLKGAEVASLGFEEIHYGPARRKPC
jgi:hypothetical protein